MNILSIFLGLLLAIIFIIIGIYIIIEYKIKYIETNATIEKAYCVLNNPNFNYLCDLQLSYIVNNYKYYARINKYINLVPYRKYDVITIFYNYFYFFHLQPILTNPTMIFILNLKNLTIVFYNIVFLSYLQKLPSYLRFPL